MTPIEQKFWDACWPAVPGLYRLSTSGLTVADLLDQLVMERAAQIIVAPQVVWDRYRTDFTILARKRRRHGGGVFRLIVECDGHAFHALTKEQVQRDRARDRYLLMRGASVMRFTGSELWSDAAACVREVIKCLDRHDVLSKWDFYSPPFVSNTLCELMDTPKVSGTPEHVAMVAGDAADNEGVARVSLSFLEQETGVSQDELPHIAQLLEPYVSMRTIDTRGRIVFRFHQRPVYPIGGPR